MASWKSKIKMTGVGRRGGRKRRWGRGDDGNKDEAGYGNRGIKQRKMIERKISREKWREYEEEVGEG